MDWVLANKDALWLIVTTVISAAAAIAAITPSESDNKVIASVRKVVDLLGLNILNAKNK